MSEYLKELQLEQGRFCWRELGEGRPLVLLHGWSMSHAVFGELAELLANDFRLLIPDLPGHGESAAAEPCSLDSFSQILACWLKELGLEQVDLLGWSLGGQLGLQFSALYPQMIRRLLLLSTTPRFCAGDNWSAGLPQTELRALRRGLQRRYLVTMGDFFDLQFAGEDLSAERRREILKFAVRPASLPDPAAALLTLDLLGQEDLRPLLTSIDRQALVIHGENDQIIPAAAGRYLADNLPDARFVPLPGIGHAPLLSCPVPLARLMSEFCQ
jgi:pimeloyl-[acyl-carrier protein] methyl ester esterase